MDITRRQFLKGAAAVTLLCGLGAIVHKTGLIDFSKEDDQIAVGPLLLGGIICSANGDAVTARYQGTDIFTMNQSGYTLLKLADGTHSFDDICERYASEMGRESIADFYLTLGQGGWLCNRFEVTKYAVEA